MPYEDIDKQRAYQLAHYRANKRVYHERNARLVRERRLYLSRLKENTDCADCGKRYPACAMDFHHLDPSEKIANVSALPSYGWRKMLAEIEKCVILCSNCHRVRTFGGNGS